MKVSVLTMYEKLCEIEAKEVILPGEDGELSVWDNHQPCLYALRAGKITIVTEPKTPIMSSISIKRGIVHVEANCLAAMVEI